MMNLVITIRGTIDDKTEAQRILGYIEDFLETYPEDELIANCKTTEVIING